MNLSLRQKLIAIVLAITVAFVVLVDISLILNDRMENQTAMIRNQFIPHVELGYRLETHFENMRMAFRDAVSAEDPGTLESARKMKDGLVNELNGAVTIVDAQQAQKVKAAVEAYFAAAFETSQRLIHRETGLQIVEAMNDMQSKHSAAAAMIAEIGSFDRGRLNDAFDSIAAAQKRGARSLLLVSICCVSFVFFVSLVMGRALMLRLKEISRGVAEFGAGKFGHPILVSGQDEISQLSRQINQMAKRIQTLIRDSESFNYSIAHDLRAPLRSMLGFSKILNEEYATQLNDDGRHYLQRISLACQRMASMIEGLLSLSRLNRATLKRQSADLSQIADRIVDVLKTGDPKRNIEFNIESGLIAAGDPELLDIALSNLIGNAWKFTAKAESPRIAFGRKMDSNDSIYFVRDNGAGFDMSRGQKLFGMFKRLHSDSEFEGHGIGLATVKSIIDKHSGRIWAESEPGKGTTFYFTLA